MSFNFAQKIYFRGRQNSSKPNLRNKSLIDIFFSAKPCSMGRKLFLLTWKCFISVLRVRIRIDPHLFGKLDPDPDSHQSEKLDPDPHQKWKAGNLRRSFWTIGGSKFGKKPTPLYLTLLFFQVCQSRKPSTTGPIFFKTKRSVSTYSSRKSSREMIIV